MSPATFLVILLGISCTAFGMAADEVTLGTTLVAVKFNDGIVVAADSRTSVSGYVSHRFANKIAHVSDRCVILRSGSAAETQHLAEAAKWTFLFRKYRYGLSPTVSQIAHWVRSTVYDGTDGASLLVAGCNDDDGSTHLYSIAQSGALIEESLFAASGSGSTYVMGYLDHNIPPDTVLLNRDTAERICRQAVELAINRDGSSGGTVRMVMITKDGTKETLFDIHRNQPTGALMLTGFAASTEASGITHVRTANSQLSFSRHAYRYRETYIA